jgi:hypothetical protein
MALRTFQIRLPDDEYAHLGRIAASRSLSMNAAARQLIASAEADGETLETLLSRAATAIDQARQRVNPAS